MSGIAIEDVHKSFGRSQVLKGVSCHASAGSITGLLGPNGAGKSTLLRCMLGLALPDRGRTTFDGQDYRALPVPPHVVGTLLDAGAHHPRRTALATLRIACAYLGLPSTRAKEALVRVGLGDVLSRRFGALSLGMKQRVGVAIATLGSPHTLILDEPMNGLDVESSHWLRAMLLDFASQGGTVLISSHLLRELEAFVHRVVILSDGVAVYEGPPSEPSAKGCLVRAADLGPLTQQLDSEGIAWEWANRHELSVRTTTEVVGALALRSMTVLSHLTTTGGLDLEGLYLSKASGDFVPTEDHP